MTGEMSLAAACGLYCGDCEFIEKQCRGCGPTHGKPFWSEKYSIEICPLYSCCVNQKQLVHCGMCHELPCEIFTSLRDPSLSDEEAEQSLRERQKDLILRKEIGTEAWLREKDRGGVQSK
jgi:hypothetical protein